MLTSKTLCTITDMRKNADGLLHLAHRLKQPIGILKNNKLKGYFLDAEVFETLQSLIEGFLDAQTAQERLPDLDKNVWQDFEKFWQKNSLAK